MRILFLTSTRATRRIGDHKKNSVAVQKDISLFTKSVSMPLYLVELTNILFTALSAYGLPAICPSVVTLTNCESQGELSVLSVPIDHQVDVYAEPVSWEAK